MKRFLCAEEGYALFPMKVTPVRGNYLMRCTVAIILFFGLPIMIGTTPVVAKESLTGGALDSIQPLQIGDTIPEGLWHLPLEVVNHSQGRNTITLDAYRGKTILLDFLSTGCSGCIAALPKLEGLRDEFTGELFVLPVTGQTRETVAAFLPKNKYTADLSLPFIVEDSILKAYFPHLYISHVVWISAEGVVRAFTATSHVTARTIREFQSGKPLDWPVKTETTSFFNAPLAVLNPEAGQMSNNIGRKFHYVMITGYTEGVGPYVPTRADSLAGIQRVSFRNRSILDLYRIALGRDFPGDTPILWEVPEPAKYVMWKADRTVTTYPEWQQRYAICYERTYSLGTERKVWAQQMHCDLNSMLGLNGRLEVRGDIKYFVLSMQ